MADGQLQFGYGDDLASLTAALLPLPGVGPWTVGYVAMRVLGAPDVFLANDAAVRNGIRALAAGGDAGGDAAAPDFREVSPWRSYATMHLWRAAGQTPSAGHRRARRSPPAPSESDAMKAQLLTMSTPDGPFTILARDGVVLSSGWTCRPRRPDRADPPRPCGPHRSGDGDRPAGDLRRRRRLLQRRPRTGHGGARPAAFRAVPRPCLGRPAGGAHPVSPVTYTEYAALAGNAKAVRAAASACAFNAAALFVPCHRVIRTDGTLGGFRWGLQVKESLLAREAA